MSAPEDAPAPLTDFQLEVARVFFGLPVAKRFLLTGGAALVAHRMTHRPTRDLDFVTSRGPDVAIAGDEFERAAALRDWVVTRVQESATFCRLQVDGPDVVLVDLMVDAPPNGPRTASALGPTLNPEDLAGRKLLALLDRAAARDFVDVFELARMYDLELLMDWAAAIDQGLDRLELARQMRMLDSYTDQDLPCAPEQVVQIREFFRSWAATLDNG
jgi:hypothetical protein